MADSVTKTLAMKEKSDFGEHKQGTAAKKTKNKVNQRRKMFTYLLAYSMVI